MKKIYTLFLTALVMFSLVSLQTQAQTNPNCNLNVSYTYAATPNGPNVIAFTNTSTGYVTADTIQWEFGDGTSSSQISPTHTYTTAGTYNVCLIIRRVVPPGAAPCLNYTCHSIVVTLPCNLTAAYTSQPSSSNTLGVYFTNTSAGFATGDSIKWSFGDGTYAYTPNAYHAYANAGTYTVCLHVRKASTGTVLSPCVSDICHPVTVTVANTCNLTAAFTSQPSSTNTLGVYFSNTSAGFATGDSIKWSFGDGTYAYTPNAYHAYANAGTYTVCLHVRKASTGTVLSPCVSDICHPVTVTVPNACNLVAAYSYLADGTQPNLIHFTNQSTGFDPTDSITWVFGDGSPNAYTPNPDHLYTTNGNFNACMIVKKNSTVAGATPCVKYICKTISITLPNTCNLVVSFTSHRDSTTFALYTYHFENTSTPLSSTDSISWTFGDGTSSSSVSPTHVYAQSGTYVVCLRVQKRDANGGLTTCIRTSCVTIVIQPTCTLHSNYTWLVDSQNPLLVHFTNTTGFPGTNVITTWYFGDGSSASTQNTNHTFANAGTYYVCLRTQYGTCVSYHCDSVRVTAPVCTLHSNYTWVADSQNPLLIHFTNTSTPVATNATVNWYFGDNTSATTYNVNHTFDHAGTYYVCLREQIGTCVSYHCDSIHVTAPVCTLQSGYTWTADSQNPLLIHFTNTTTPATPNTTYAWYFGDNTSATTLNADHTFAHAGTFYVCLRSQSGTCVSYHCDSIRVTAPLCTLQSAYTWAADSQNPQLIHFTNTTNAPAGTNVITAWYFGDGSSAATFNADHQYAQPGNYYVCLRTQVGTCVSYHCDSIHVMTPVCTLVASFTFYRDSIGTAPNTYHFTNTSTPVSTPDSVRWTFGDGSSSNSYSPTHSYAQPGTYTVCLRMQHRNANGTLSTCVSEICHTITVVQACNIQPSYTWRADSVNYKKIYFTNTTTIPTSTITATWNFGDGATATSWNAIHEYAQPGRYYVCLRIQYGTCVTYHCDSITINTPQVPCSQLADFHSISTSATSLSVAFVPNNIYSDVTYNWTFGDGTGSTGPTATHTYATAGTYTVCLSAIRSNTCTATSCITIHVPAGISCSNITLGFTNTANPTGANSMTFTATSNAPTTDQVWTISRVPASATGSVTIHANNPTYNFADTGYYNVCLHATFAGGCVKEYCRVIHVSYPVGGNVCSLQVYPNPASSVVNLLVTLTQPQVISAVVYNNANMQVLQRDQQGFVGSNTVTLNIATLAPGAYTVRVSYGGQVCYATFIKQQ